MFVKPTSKGSKRNEKEGGGVEEKGVKRGQEMSGGGGGHTEIFIKNFKQFCKIFYLTYIFTFQTIYLVRGRNRKKNIFVKKLFEIINLIAVSMFLLYYY